MVQYCYQGVPASPPPPTVAIASGSLTSAKAGAWYFALQYRNLAGYSPVSSVVSSTITAGNGFSITIPGLALPSPNGCQIWEYCLLASRSSDFSNPSLIATYPGYDTNGTTVLNPPFVILLNQDEHLELAKTVTSSAGLPSGSNRLHGQRRFLDDPSDLPNRMLAWNQYLSAWEPTFPQLFDTRVSSISGSNGALRDLSAIEDTQVIRYPSYSLDPSIGMRPVGFWLINDGNTVIPSATPISFAVDINGEDVSTLDGIVGGLELQFVGYVNVSTGVLDTADMTIGPAVDYQGPSTGLTLQKDLPIGYAYCFTVRAKFTALQLNGRAFQGSVLGFEPSFFTNFSVYSPVDLFGSLIANRYELRRIVPRTGLSALALKGSGTIEIPDGGSLSFNNVGAQVVPGLLANTANQNCIISVGGTCYVAASVPAGAELRAKIGTIDGAGSATDFNTTPVTLTSATLLQVNVTFPTQIRSDYPDVIAGSADGTFNGTKVRFYLKNGTTGVVTQFDANITPNTSSQTFTIGSVAGTSLGAVTPPSAASDFGLYGFNSASYSLTPISGASVFTTANYTLAIAIVWQNAVTYISHDSALGCIYEASDSFGDLFAAQRYFGEPAANLTALRSSVDPTSVFNQQLRLVSDVGGFSELYRYSSADAGTDDTTNTSAIATANVLPGRWRSLNRSGSGGGAAIHYLLDSATTTGPAIEKIRFNDSNPSNATTIYVSETARGSIDVTNLLNQVTTGSLLLASSDLDPKIFHWYTLGTPSDNGTYRTFPVTHLSGTGSYAVGSGVSIGLILAGTPGAAGDIGPTGMTGNPAFGGRFTFSTSTSTAPTTGQLRFNSGTLSSVTAIYVSKTDRSSGEISNVLDLFTSGSSLQVVKEGSGTVYGYFTITGTQTNNTNDRVIPVSYVSGGSGSFSASDNVSLMPAIKGDPGAAGSNGANAYTSIASPGFTQPSIGGTVAAPFLTTAWMPVGINIYINGGGYYSVESIESGTTATVKNLGYTGNASPGATISTGAAVSAGGVKGLDGAGSGSVTSFSAGALSPLFSTSVATATSTPALTFTLTNQSANTFFAGPTSGSDAAPTMRALAIADLPLLSENAQTGTTYTLVLSDRGKLVSMNNATANTLTVPPNSSAAFPVGTEILVRQRGAGQTTIAAGSGVTITSANDKLKLRVQQSGATLVKDGTDSWWLIGDIAT